MRHRAQRPGVQRGKDDAKSPAVLGASSAELRRASSNINLECPTPPYPPQLREYQEAHARCRSRTTYPATIAVTLNVDRPLYIARIQALSHQGRTPASRFPPTASISDRTALLPLSFPYPPCLDVYKLTEKSNASTFESAVRALSRSSIPLRLLSFAARILSSHCALSVVCPTARGPTQRNSARFWLRSHELPDVQDGCLR